MCLLIYKPAGKAIPADYIQNGFAANPDGAGIAFADGSELHLLKPYWDANEVVAELQSLDRFPCLVHFRWGTHGAMDDSNVHPFALPNGWAMAHNGVIQVPTQGDESDTRAYIREFVAPACEQNPHAPLNRRIKAMMHHDMGGYSKLAFLHSSGRASLVNASLGVWDGGIWYSNHGYKHAPYVFKGCGFGRGRYGSMAWDTDEFSYECWERYMDYREAGCTLSTDALAAKVKAEVEADEEAALKRRMKHDLELVAKAHQDDPFFASDRWDGILERVG